MPKIDQLVDATIGHSQMSFLDAFQGYHQIPLALNDQKKTAFVTLVGNYHYKVMPFGLKNTRSTYQRMMTRMFESQLGKNIKIYIDDMVVNVRWFQNIWETLELFLKFLESISCAQMLLSVHSVWDQANSQAIWSLTEGLKLTPTRLRLLITCHHLGIPRRCRN